MIILENNKTSNLKGHRESREFKKNKKLQWMNSTFYGTERVIK